MELTKSYINLKNIYDKKYSNFAQFKEELCKNIQNALEQVEKGEIMTMEEVITEMEELYNIKL